MNQQSLSQVSQKENWQGSQRVKQKAPVYLNTYHFSTCFNCFCKCLGIGVYHTGVEVFNYEYMYFGFDGDETGVGYLEPKTAAYQFKEQKLLGYTQYRLNEIEEDVLEPLMIQFIGRLRITQEIGMTCSTSTAITFRNGSHKCCKLKKCPKKYSASLISSTGVDAASQIVYLTDDSTGLTLERRTTMNLYRKVNTSHFDMIMSIDEFFVYQPGLQSIDMHSISKESEVDVYDSSKLFIRNAAIAANLPEDVFNITRPSDTLSHFLEPAQLYR